jgi:hypothetical protein
MKYISYYDYCLKENKTITKSDFISSFLNESKLSVSLTRDEFINNISQSLFESSDEYTKDIHYAIFEGYTLYSSKQDWFNS